MVSFVLNLSVVSPGQGSRKNFEMLIELWKVKIPVSPSSGVGRHSCSWSRWAPPSPSPAATFSTLLLVSAHLALPVFVLASPLFRPDMVGWNWVLLPGTQTWNSVHHWPTTGYLYLYMKYGGDSPLGPTMAKRIIQEWISMILHRCGCCTVANSLDFIWFLPGDEGPSISAYGFILTVLRDHCW